jgi:hypothetical protein
MTDSSAATGFGAISATPTHSMAIGCSVIGPTATDTAIADSSVANISSATDPSGTVATSAHDTNEADSSVTDSSAAGSGAIDATPNSSSAIGFAGIASFGIVVPPLQSVPRR